MSSSSARLLLVEDDEGFKSLLKAILEEEGYTLVVREDGKSALMALQRSSFDLVLSDLRLPGLSGLELFRMAKEQDIAPPFILLTAFGTVEEAVAAIKEGVADFLTKPLKDPETLRTIIRKNLVNSSNRRVLATYKERDASELPPAELIFSGKAMQNIQNLLQEVAKTQATVLITGESGTGKELAARTIHKESQRAKAPFIAINCAAIPENLLESELFGHEKGAFTGATQTRQGKFEIAAGGTIFLDEIGELPFNLQGRFLRVLQERVFERVGGNRQIHTDVRVIAATNRNLAEEVKKQLFREDLYYRLNVFPIQMPALRERKECIPKLVEFILKQQVRQTGKIVNGIDDDVIAKLMQYHWPGNIRELRNLIERAVIICKDKITLSELPEFLPGQEVPDTQTTTMNLRNIERIKIIEALEHSGQNRRLAAEILGISRRTLQYRLKDYGIVD